ncbi:unnamed protein product [Rotaria sordida]|uniref:Uncharacterized protein n=1 Tax=Rotaria sordida TaxID=392033 RepID=A0A816BW30_9BILA|nr:unnamed protein product [Rotaria sordida]CAF1614206.1 unnamed protein product [Rotaria sordida]
MYICCFSGSACSSHQFQSSLEDYLRYEYINDEQQGFWKHLCFTGKTDESMYTINLTNNQTTTPADSSLLLLLLSTYDDSPLLDLLFHITTKRKYEDKHSYVYEQINTTPNSEIF